MKLFKSLSNLHLSLFIFGPCLAILVSSCGPNVPAEQEVRTRLMGEYCEGGYRMVIEDSTYTHRLAQPGALNAAPNYEYCSGSYTLSLKEDQWYIHFDKSISRQSSLLSSCEREYLIWSPKEGYVNADGQNITMKDLFNETTLIKGSCE